MQYGGVTSNSGTQGLTVFKGFRCSVGSDWDYLFRCDLNMMTDCIESWGGYFHQPRHNQPVKMPTLNSPGACRMRIHPSRWFRRNWHRFGRRAWRVPPHRLRPQFVGYLRGCKRMKKREMLLNCLLHSRHSNPLGGEHRLVHPTKPIPVFTRESIDEFIRRQLATAIVISVDESLPHGLEDVAVNGILAIMRLGEELWFRGDSTHA